MVPQGGGIRATRLLKKNLGEKYKLGRGVAKDGAEAEKWYRKAADLGDTSAQAILGLMYYKGEGVAIDEAEAVKWIPQGG